MIGSDGGELTHRLAHHSETAAVRVDERPPGIDPFPADPELLEGIAHLLRQPRGVVPLAGPGLGDDPVQEDVGERRLVALVARRLLGGGQACPRAVEIVDVATATGRA